MVNLMKHFTIVMYDSRVIIKSDGLYQSDDLPTILRGRMI